VGTRRLFLQGKAQGKRAFFLGGGGGWPRTEECESFNGKFHSMKKKGKEKVNKKSRGVSSQNRATEPNVTAKNRTPAAPKPIHKAGGVGGKRRRSSAARRIGVIIKR